MATIREVYLFRLACDPPVRCWTGIGDLAVPGDIVDSGGTIYSGVGELLNLPAVQQLINGTAERVQFIVSGVTAETLRLAMEDRDSVNGAQARIGSLVLDNDLQPVGSISWEWRGIADVIEVGSTIGQDGNRVRTITLSVASADTGRSRADLAYFTDADQRRRSPTDAIFSHVAGINAGTSRRFGPND